MAKYILFLWVPFILCLCACQTTPYFGNKVKEKSSSEKILGIWFPKFPKQFSIKHVAEIKFSQEGETTYLDFIGYLMGKKGQGRFLAINETGLTVLDVYMVDGEYTIVRAVEELRGKEFLHELLEDVFLIFFSPERLKNLELTEYSLDNTSIFVHSKENKWTSWEIEKRQEKQIRRGEGNTSLSVITYESPNEKNFNFPSKIKLYYPLYHIEIDLKILSIEEKDISDDKFLPKNDR